MRGRNGVAVPLVDDPIDAQLVDQRELRVVVAGGAADLLFAEAVGTPIDLVRPAGAVDLGAGVPVEEVDDRERRGDRLVASRERTRRRRLPGRDQ
jgi:hypothetical protein